MSNTETFSGLILVCAMWNIMPRHQYLLDLGRGRDIHPFSWKYPVQVVRLWQIFPQGHGSKFKLFCVMLFWFVNHSQGKLARSLSVGDLLGECKVFMLHFESEGSLPSHLKPQHQINVENTYLLWVSQGSQTESYLELCLISKTWWSLNL